jgi:predicted transcriptional regulator
MTIVDSAGQKENVFQMRKAAKHLSKSVEDEKSLIHEFSSELQQVTNLKDELLLRIAETQEWRDGVLEQLKRVAEEKKDNNTIEIVEVEQAMIKETEKQLHSRNIISMMNLRKIILSILSKNQPLSISEMARLNPLFFYGYNKHDIKLELSKMMEEGLIFTTIDEKYYLSQMK